MRKLWIVFAKDYDGVTIYLKVVERILELLREKRKIEVELAFVLMELKDLIQ